MGAQPWAAWSPLMAFALCLWASATATMLLSASWGAETCLILAGASLLAGAAIAVAMCRRVPGGVVLIALLGCCAGSLLAGSAAAHLHSIGEQLSAVPSALSVMTVVEDSREGDHGPSCVASGTLADGSRVKVRVNLPEGVTADCWQVIRAHAAIEPAAEAAEPLRAYLWRKGCVGTVRLRQALVDDPASPMRFICGFRRACQHRWDCIAASYPDRDGDAVALVEAVLLGSRAKLFASSLYADVKVVGLAHVVAVSGAHLVVVAGFFATVLKLLRVPRRGIIVAQACFVIAYAAFTGMPISALRAAVMSICSLFAFFAERRSSSVTALGICVVCMITLHPSLALSASLALSCSASLGIVLLSRPVTACLDDMLHGHARWASSALGTTLSANVLTVGIAASLFNQVPLVAPLSNVIAVPLFSAMVVVGMMSTMVGVACPAFALGAAMPAMALARTFCACVHILAQVPHACVSADVSTVAAVACSVAVAFAMARFRPRLTRYDGWALVVAGAALTACLLFAFPRFHGCEVAMIDVGQGDAVVYRQGAHAVLVDTGTNDAKLLRGLARHDVRALDAVIISHPDDDHCGSLPALLATVPVARVYVARDALTCSCDKCSALRSSLGGCHVEGIAQGDEIRWGGYSLQVIAPQGFVSEGDNQDSLVMVVRCDCNGDGIGDWTVLTSGDAESEVLVPLMRAAHVGDVDILKVPHHGSAQAVDAALLQVVKPRVSLIGVGADNRYGHPAQETIDQLEEAGSLVFRTDVDGDVVCSLTPQQINVTCLR
jgi:competence protein ComEC